MQKFPADVPVMIAEYGHEATRILNAQGRSQGKK